MNGDDVEIASKVARKCLAANLIAVRDMPLCSYPGFQDWELFVTQHPHRDSVGCGGGEADSRSYLSIQRLAAWEPRKS